MLHAFQDPANGPLIACLEQLWDLRRVGFSLVSCSESLDQFIIDLQDFVQEHSLRLESIHTRVFAGRASYSRKYTRQSNVRNDLVGWEVEYGECGMPQFVDRW